MSDYYQAFTIDVPLPTAEAQAYAFELTAGIVQGFCGAGDLPEGVTEEDLKALNGWSCKLTPIEPYGIRIEALEGRVEGVLPFIRHLLRKFDRKGRVEVQWGCYSSPIDVDGLGSGAAIITARSIRMMTPYDWLEENRRRSRKTRAAASTGSSTPC